MDFAYTAAQTALAGELAALFGRFPAPPRLRAWADAGIAAFDGELWQALADQRWLGLTLAPADGGRGLGTDALTLAACEAGRALAPVPLVATLLAGEAFNTPTQRAALATGELRVALCLPPPGQMAPTLAVVDGRASGMLAPVADGLLADAVLGADAAGGAWLVDLRGEVARRRQLETLDLAHTAAELTLTGAPALALGSAGLWRDRAAILTAFEQLGGAQRCLDLAVAYAKERYAFGQPIGAFQAVKHKLAALHVEIELARANAYYGAYALAQGEPAVLAEAAALARASATDTYLLAAQESLHVHGGVGFTWACEAHLHLRRARALEAALGSAALWRERLLEAPAALANP
ncbi:acyl-CoA dehydrogenase family protein [Immundisolibacter sp.]